MRYTPGVQHVMANQYSQNDAGGVGVIRYVNHHHTASFGNNGNGSTQSNIAVSKVCSPISPLSPLESGHSSGSSIAYSAKSPTEETDTLSEVQLALRQIESHLLLDDKEEEHLSGNTSMFDLDLTREFIEQTTDPKQLLLMCAECISNGSFQLADIIISRLHQVTSIYGTPMQRLAAYMVEGLVARTQLSGTGLCRALRCREPVGNEILSAMQVMYEVCPYIKFGYMAANGAIAEALKDEQLIHIIDFEIAQGTQYISLIQAMALRPGGPPRVRITGVGDPTADVAAPGGVYVVGQRLTKLAHSVNVPFEFVPVSMNASKVTSAMLDRRPGETLAVNFAMQLHHMPDESVLVSNPRDSLLRLAKSLEPKIVTLVEQEANTNTAPFLARFKESLDYYSAVFESLDVTLPRESRERVSVEQHCLARDLVNLIACEGVDRVERHEVMGKWKARMNMAGFRQCPLSNYVNHTIKGLLKTYCEKYKLTEENGVLYLGWQDRSLVSASAWN